MIKIQKKTILLQESSGLVLLLGPGSEVLILVALSLSALWPHSLLMCSSSSLWCGQSLAVSAESETGMGESPPRVM